MLLPANEVGEGNVFTGMCLSEEGGISTGSMSFFFGSITSVSPPGEILDVRVLSCDSFSNHCLKDYKNMREIA